MFVHGAQQCYHLLAYGTITERLLTYDNSASLISPKHSRKLLDDGLALQSLPKYGADVA